MFYHARGIFNSAHCGEEVTGASWLMGANRYLGTKMIIREQLAISLGLDSACRSQDILRVGIVV